VFLIEKKRLMRSAVSTWTGRWKRHPVVVGRIKASKAMASPLVRK
jgi:hypothetical protein